MKWTKGGAAGGGEGNEISFTDKKDDPAAVVKALEKAGYTDKGDMDVDDLEPYAEEKERIEESAIDDLRKIVKTKSMGKVSGSKVDLFSASAMVQVYDALNDKNKTKVDKMLKDKRGVLTFADFAMSQMK